MEEFFTGGAFAIAGFLGFIAARMSRHIVWERIQSWFDPWPHAQDIGVSNPFLGFIGCRF